jgi:HD-GYP domain-containing protein (c-di-GMP phosphodiesterase class II)
MTRKTTSYHLIDQVLAKNIYSNSGVLLLSQGHVIKVTDIEMLLNREIYKLEIDERVLPLSENISSQYTDLWASSSYALKDQYLESLTKIKNLFQTSIDGRLLPLNDFMKAYSPLLEKTLTHSFLFHPLHKIKGHDEYTYRHSLNVGLLSAVIGKILQLPANETLLLGQMGLLHDIGKLKVEDNILNKPGKLTQEEFIDMKQHTIYGYELLKEMEGTNEYIYNGALYHHERLDGTGYPYGIKGEEIPFLIQIVSVADTYDAICSDRAYRKRSSPYYAAQELMNSAYSGKLNLRIVIPFLRYLAEGYIGDNATLDNGEVGEIVFIHAEEPHRPLIRVGEEYIDLRKRRDIQILDFQLQRKS